ncbi:hypothetical protein HCC30_23350 [Streptomyces sp. HNM0574]|nr:hypothetical protein [Streptomyces sp. HNM0574]
MSGCVTVHGEQAIVPAVSKKEARETLDSFVKTNNEANTKLDPKLNSTIETGVLGAIDQATLKGTKKIGTPGEYDKLHLSDTRFLIPKQAGWPKFFVADSATNREGNDRWLFVFERNSSKEDWKASYLSVLGPDEIPNFATDKDGYVKPVPTGSRSGLAVAPDKLSKTYTRFLKDGGDEFAPGPHTSGWRQQREAVASNERMRTEYIDLPALPPQFAPFGLETDDGGALVFFGSQHHVKQTVAAGYTPQVKNKLAKALMEGKPKQSVTHVRMSQQAVTVPPADESGAKVTFLNRITGLTSVKGS